MKTKATNNLKANKSYVISKGIPVHYLGVELNSHMVPVKTVRSVNNTMRVFTKEEVVDPVEYEVRLAGDMIMLPHTHQTIGNSSVKWFIAFQSCWAHKQESWDADEKS